MKRSVLLCYRLFCQKKGGEAKAEPREDLEGVLMINHDLLEILVLVCLLLSVRITAASSSFFPQFHFDLTTNHLQASKTSVDSAEVVAFRALNFCQTQCKYGLHEG